MTASPTLTWASSSTKRPGVADISHRTPLKMRTRPYYTVEGETYVKKILDTRGGHSGVLDERFIRELSGERVEASELENEGFT